MEDKNSFNEITNSNKIRSFNETENTKLNSENQTTYSSFEGTRKMYSDSLSMISDSSESGNYSETQDPNISSDQISQLRPKRYVSRTLLN